MPVPDNDPEGPTVYATLMEDGIGANLAFVEKETKTEAERMTERIVTGVKQEMRTAYMAGLAHGFQQGVAAECKRRDTDDAATSQEANRA